MRGENGDTRLLAGTRSRLFCNTGLDGNWRVIYDNAGGVRPEAGVAETRWKFAQIGGISIFTNGVDSPIWWSHEGAGGSGFEESAAQIDDLIALDITVAKTVGAWRGFMFLGNTVTEGTTNVNRVYWSDFNDPLSFTPLPDSLAGYIDLSADERVLAMEPIGGQFRVYTDKAIYDVNLVGGDEVFNFREIYRGPSALRFENSLVNLGSTHIYAGEDTVYVLGELDRAPQRIDWIFKASGAIYDGVRPEYLGGIPSTTIGSYGKVNRKACYNVVGGYNEQDRQVWMSWCADDEIVPARSLVLQLDTQKSCIVDAGFTAFCAHLPTYQVSVRRWLADLGICDPKAAGSLMVKEGNPYPQIYVKNETLLYTRNQTENIELPASANSLCQLTDQNPSLEPDCTPCSNGYKFIMASAQDKCLKEYDPDYYAREICITSEANRGYPYSAWSSTDHPTTSTCNAAPGSYSVSYEDRGYVTILQTDSQDIGSPTNKTVQRVAVEYDAPDVVDANAAKLHVDIGYGAQPRQLIWQDSTPRPIDRLSTEAEAALIAANKRPNRMATFPFFRTGSQIGFRIMVADANKGPVIGGAVSLNEMSVGMRVSHGDYY